MMMTSVITNSIEENPYKKLIVSQLVRKCPHFKEAESSLQRHNSPPLVPVLSYMKPLCALLTDFFQIHVPLGLASLQVSAPKPTMVMVVVEEEEVAAATALCLQFM